MHPAFSVIFLTTLIGVGQGLLLALVAGQFYFVIGATDIHESGAFYGLGSLIAVAFLGAGLVSSFFHLAHPERGWRAIARWRTSWLSREVLLLPAVVGLTVIYGAVHWLGWNPVLVTFTNLKALDLTMATGFVAAAASVLLFVCTGMIYACVKFIREWASPLTVINYLLMGGASGFTLAAAYAVMRDSALGDFFAGSALVATLTAAVFRIAAMIRNRRLAPPATLRAAIGVHHADVRQVTQGFMGRAFNTQEFASPGGAAVRELLSGLFLALAFVVPAVLLLVGWLKGGAALFAAAFACQYVGLAVERWVFFAEGRHVQNLYYQRAA